MKCDDCGFEHSESGACPRCGYTSSFDLLEAVKVPNPPLTNYLEAEFSKLCQEAEKDPTVQERARRHWERLNEKAKNGNAEARHLVARVALSRQEYDTAVKILTPLAEAGFALAQFDLGKMYEEGLGVEADIYHAIRLFRQAAAQGNPIAIFMLAQQHLEGGNLTPDPALANATMQALVATYPTMFKRKGGCACQNGMTDVEFAKKTASQIGKFIKYGILLALAAFIAAIIWSELHQ